MATWNGTAISSTRSTTSRGDRASGVDRASGGDRLNRADRRGYRALALLSDRVAAAALARDGGTLPTARARGPRRRRRWHALAAGSRRPRRRHDLRGRHLRRACGVVRAALAEGA